MGSGSKCKLNSLPYTDSKESTDIEGKGGDKIGTEKIVSQGKESQTSGIGWMFPKKETTVLETTKCVHNQLMLHYKPW